MKTIPAQFSSNETLSNSYKMGWNHGHGIACHNVPKLGAKIFTDGMGRVTVDSENIREVHESICYEAEINSRDFSPFEFTAHELNSLDDEENENEISSEEAWEAFEAGTSDAISADLATYSDEDYGIENE